MPKPSITAKTKAGKPKYKRRLPMQKLMRANKLHQLTKKDHEITERIGRIIKKPETKALISEKMGKGMPGSVIPPFHRLEFSRQLRARESVDKIQKRMTDNENKYGKGTINMKKAFKKRKVPAQKPKPPKSAVYNPLHGHKGLHMEKPRTQRIN